MRKRHLAMHLELRFNQAGDLLAAVSSTLAKVAATMRGKAMVASAYTYSIVSGHAY